MWSLLLIPVGLIVLFMLIVIYQFFIKIYIDAARFRRMDPKLRTFITPLTGLLGVQKRNIQLYGDSHHFVKAMIKDNPDQKAYLTNLGNRPFLILCDPKLIKQLSMQPKSFIKHNLYKHSQKAYTKGIFLVEDDDWTAERSIISHSFSHDQLKKMVPLMIEVIDVYCVKLKARSGGKPIRIGVVSECQVLIGEILVKAFFSENATSKQVNGKTLSLALADFTTSMFNRSRTGTNIFFSWLLGDNATRYNFSQADKDLENQIDQIRHILQQIIDQRRVVLKIKWEKERGEVNGNGNIPNNSNDSNNNTTTDNTQQSDFLSHYIKTQYDISINNMDSTKTAIRPITDQQIMHQLVSFYFAGIDTTGHLVAMALYALSQYPRCGEKVRDEISQVMKNQTDFTYDNLQKLNYLSYFLDQCLRMWPPAVGILSRRTRTAIQIGPYSLPADTCIGTNIIGLMHNEKYFTNPSIFNPQRWLDKQLLKSEPYAFIPFSAGRRSCIGKYMALMETKLIVSRVMKAFVLKRTDVPLRMHAKFLYEPVDEDLIELHERGNSSGDNLGEKGGKEVEMTL